MCECGTYPSCDVYRGRGDAGGESAVDVDRVELDRVFGILERRRPTCKCLFNPGSCSIGVPKCVLDKACRRHKILHRFIASSALP